jgi:hypothetical protein
MAEDRKNTDDQNEQAARTAPDELTGSAEEEFDDADDLEDDEEDDAAEGIE